MRSPEINEMLNKYQEKLNEQLDTPTESQHKVIFSREYSDFKKEYLPTHLSLYEKFCNLSEKILRLKPDKKKEPLLQESINVCHLNITPSGAVSFSILVPLLIIVFGGMISYLLTEGYFFPMVFLCIGALLLNPLAKLPSFLANNWRLKSSNQMVLSIFYVVTYMRHTSNLELAIEFASEHLSGPLALDLKKVLWDVETERYESIKESLDMYLETWRKWNMEYIEAFHLIESSLYEGTEDRRVTMLDKSLDVILSETYEKMLHYAHNLKSPITMLHMMGIILPILGLVVLPLVISFMQDVRWYHLATLYNIAIPISIFYLGKSILAKRPTGYGDTDITETNPELKKYKNVIINIGKAEVQINPVMISMLIFIVFFIIGLSPVILHYILPNEQGYGIGDPDESTPCGLKYCLLGYRESVITEGLILGPYGMGASILSLFIPLSFGISLGLYWKLKSKNVIKIRENAKRLEKEFASALFQLGNRLGDGLPAEIAFGKVADTMRDTVSGNFFQMVNINIRKLGMSVRDAIFNPRSGALMYFPSNLIESSMKVLIESIRKGPSVAAQALVNISRYIKEIHAVNERLKDLMADIISSMKSQTKFLSPAISGIVVGITSMVTFILDKLSYILPHALGTDQSMGGVAVIANMFGDGLPTYYFQIVVGIYVVQLIYILTVLTNGIENGSDKLGEKYNLGVNMTKSVMLYSIIALIVMILFNLIAGQIMARSLSGL